MAVVDDYWERCHRHLYFLKFILKKYALGGPKLNYHTPGLAAVCVWSPIWDVPWTCLLIGYEKLVLCSRNSRVRHFFKAENMKRKCTENKCSHFVQLRRPSQEFGGTGEQGHFFSGEKGKNLKIRGTGEHMQFWGIGNIENQDFVFG